MRKRKQSCSSFDSYFICAFKCFFAIAFVLISLSTPIQSSAQEQRSDPNPDAYRDWTIMRVPGTWDEHSSGELSEYDGIAWYRCGVTIPEAWEEKECQLEVANIDNAYEVFFNGEKLGGEGSFPPDYVNGLEKTTKFLIPAKLLRFGDGENMVAIRVYDHDGRGGFKSIAPLIISGDSAIAMNGRWEFRVGDDANWANGKTSRSDTGIFYRAMTVREARARASGSDLPLSPHEALKTFTVADDLELSLVLSEPHMTQPVFFNFDERGRMWVMNYVQYPDPAGLKILSRDDYWRNVYDKVPQAPPNHDRGADKITIHEDTDGDGHYDSHKTFVDGLSIASSFVQAQDGVWVLNPPYLLFYPDKDKDDVPDGDPEVHLAGFGIEDTHSVANSLRWGPDGWLYAAQGSTVTGNVVVVAGSKERDELDAANPPEVHRSLGQLIWRYHPVHHIYEIFAEGGGNAFGVEFDRNGFLFSGHNGGDTRGFHYVQGGYYRKGFGKHGPLSNPFAFGYFEPMAHHSAARFTHTFVIYESDGLPEKYRGNLFGVEPMQGRIVRAEMIPVGSSYKTKDLDRPVISDDSRFRPVDIKVGPDGAIYIADFYEPQISHREHFAGQIEKHNGRIYRLGAKGSKMSVPIDFSKIDSFDWKKTIDDPNSWVRDMTVRSFARPLRKGEGKGELLKFASLQPEDYSLRTMAFRRVGGVPGKVSDIDLKWIAYYLIHPDPIVRVWAIRWATDREFDPAASDGKLVDALVKCAQDSTDPHVRSQLASSARRMDVTTGMKIVVELLRNSSDLPDIHVPMLMWWAVETHCDNPEVVLKTIDENSDLLTNVRFLDTIASRLMRRFAATGKRSDLEHCAKLFEMSKAAGTAGEAATKQYLVGFEEAFKGRSLAQLPDRLGEALTSVGGGSQLLRIRRGDTEAIDSAMEALSDATVDVYERVGLIQTLGEVRSASALPVLLELFESASDKNVLDGLLVALQNYSNPEIGKRIASRYSTLAPDVRASAAAALSMRKPWSIDLLDAIDAGEINVEDVSVEIAQRLLIHGDDPITQRVSKLWPDLKQPSTQELQQKIAEIALQLEGKSGNPYPGKILFEQKCGKCHQMFGAGGNIGPDLTTFNRDDTASMLINIVDPSAEIREGFENFTVLTDDGRVATGFVADKDNQVLVIRNSEGQTISIEQEAIEEMKANRKSVMPEGLLDDLTEEQINDLFAYLRTSQPLNN